MAAGSAPSNVDVRVVAEQAAMLYRMAPAALLMSVAASTIILTVFYPLASHVPLFIWYAASNLCTAGRFTLVLAYRRAAPPPEAARSCWGVLGTPALPVHSYSYNVIFLVFNIGISAVGLFSLFPWVAAYAALTVPLIVPSALAMYWHGGDEYTLLGVVMSVYLPIALVAARSLGATVAASGATTPIRSGCGSRSSRLRKSASGPNRRPRRQTARNRSFSPT